MASDKILLHDPQWTDEDIKWYISSRPVKRLLGKSGNAPAGTIFQVDYEYSKLDEKQKEIVLKSCHKGTWKVKWAPNTFYGLDDDSKNLLLALSDENDRLRFYLALRQSLEYGKTLKRGDDVCVRLPKRKELLVGGVIKYIGPVEVESSAIWFGVELVSNSYGDTDGVFKKTGDRYFTCEQGRGIFLTIKNIKPTSVSEEEKQKLSVNFKRDGGASGRSSNADNVELTDIPQTLFIRVGDEVMLRTQMKRGGPPQLVLGHVVLVHGDHIAVDVQESEGVFKPWNGYYRGKKLYRDANQHTIWLDQSQVELVRSPTSSASSRDKGNQGRNSTAALKSIQQTNVWERSEMSVSAVNATCREEMKKNVQEVNNIHRTSDARTSHPHSLGPCSIGSDGSISDSRVSSSSSVEMSQKSDKMATKSHSFNDADKSYPGKSSKAQKSKGIKYFKDMMPSLPGPSFSCGAPPEFPFKDIHIDVLSKDRNIVENLVTELKLDEKWEEVCKSERSDFFRVDLLLKWWWSHHIQEGYTEELRRFTDLLAKHGRDDLRDHLNGVPDFGGFHETVVFVLTCEVGNRWKKFAIELGLSTNEMSERITHQMPPYEAVKNVLQIWHSKEIGSKKLAMLIKACRTVGLDDVGADIEQGLSENVLKKIARRVEYKNWVNFGAHIGVSRVRCDAFHKKIAYLAERVYQMLCWWSMRSPLNIDKAEVLSHALEACNQGNIAAEELSRGIENNDLETAACLITDRWQSVAVGLVTSRDIDYLTRYTTDVEKALHMLKIWKRRQPLSANNLKEALYSHLLNLDMCRAARQLYDGLDNGTVTHLSRKLCFDWPLLAHHFGYQRDEISRRLDASNHIDMSLIVLKEWLHANEEISTEKTKAKLKNGLMAIGREDLGEWMQRRVEDDVEDKLVKPSDEKQDHGSQFRKLDRIILEEVAEAINHLHPNSVMELLNFSADHLKTFLPKNVHMDAKRPHFAILCSWKRKMMQSGFGELDCIESLMQTLKAYGEDKAAAILVDGTSVDPEAFGPQGGAIGGASTPAHQNLTVFCMIEVAWGGRILPGVIQWIGIMKGLEEHGQIAGVELEDFAELGAGSGKFGDTRYFSCQYGKGLFVPLSRCRPDSRFLTETETYTSKEKVEKEDFGDIECDPVEGYVRPSEIVKQEHIGMFKGIQGHSSCYMDVTLYSMFAFSDIFDAVLHYEYTAKTETKNVKDALRETIVNPLRSIGFVRADHILGFRDSLRFLRSMEAFRTKEKEPEEFIQALLQELSGGKPLLKISQGNNAAKESFVYQIFTDKKKYLDIPTVENLLHVSFLESDLKLCEVPECFIIRLPRYEKYKVYDWIIPSLEMDINLLIRDSPRPCCGCGNLAIMECRDCTANHVADDIIQSFCGGCFSVVHKLKSKQQHQTNPLTIPGQFAKLYEQTAKGVEEDKIATETYHLYEKRLMELFSVVCIETSHYVAFVKAGSGEHAQWVFFDSMADRRGGGQHGYNVPEVSHLRYFEAEMKREDLKDALRRNKSLPKYLKRLLSDAYICFYRPTKSGGDISPRKPLREVEDLQGQLEQMKTKYADTVKTLEESQKMMLTFKSKSAELEAELHNTKRYLVSQQEEVERLKKEQEDGKKQTRLGTEPEEKIRKLLMAEHGLTRVAVDTVLALREEYELGECIEAVKAVGDNLQQVQEYFQKCTTCFTDFGMHKLVALPTCECLICTECFTQYFTVLVKTTTCMYKFSCPACNNPNLEDSDQEIYQFYFSLLGTLLKTYLEKKDYELYEVKLATWGLMEDPNFRWCAYGCSAGFINERRQKKIQCPDCKKYQCFDCKKPWLDQHKNISCEQFDAWKKANDPEFHQQGLAAHLKENGINCPKCKMHYELAKGGCMHFKCPQCHHQFCCGCNLPFRTNPACNLLPSCKGKGLHAHHPRDCFYYLRDENCHDLQLLLQKHKIPYNATSNAAGCNGERPQVCPVKEQQETPDGLVDATCAKPLKGQCGLCENHYKEYLVGLINQHNIDPVEVFGVKSLEATLRRNDRKIPVQAGNEANTDYCARLRQEVQQLLPLRPRNAQGVAEATYQI